ncbi:FabD/lysophospholipase-like protein [Coniochaeta ligniaria NRRL 30616]|uniref:FabD/lysophospholipase-like protein n=1 Tax=Coniochaeta ligniaria NRRL 30616 TaxID=1408157 RepID=A0A1J7I9B0_9PEZI|nr:FabD/lysophospholipase-like protein [Coniochaeta ligniaria NRRL 30616]
MLGRLRMDVNDCIQQYFIICNRIFRPHKYLSHYSAERFEKAINDVIKKHCKCHPPECQHPHTHKFRQYDYLERDEGDANAYVNGTCKVAVLTQRKAHGKGQPDTVYMMRSYNHRWRQGHSTHSSLNRGQVDSSTLKIWEACRATAAAPLFFDKILIEGRWHIDGGVGDNNPSTHAWNEASELSRTKNNGTNKVAMVVSIGTGMTEPYTKFGGLLSLAQYARKAITETEKAHENTRNFAHLVNADYFRFDVRPIREIHDGLSKTKLDECKKKKKRQQKQPTTGQEQQPQHHPQPVPNLAKDESHGDESTVENRELAREREQILANMDAHNDIEASQPGVKGGYKPEKYDYTTFRTIKRLTDDYCLSPRYSFLRHQGQQEAQNVKEEINRCACILFDNSQRRKQDDAERWQRFRRHPDPQHEANQFNPPREA